MLSFIDRAVREFRSTHGLLPNLLYLAPRHLGGLLAELPAGADTGFLSKALGMVVVVSDEVLHPHVARVHLAGRERLRFP
jgi:hypothetical protein